MAKEKKTKGEMKKENVSCADKLCPFHGANKLRLRGRVFQGEVIRKFPGKITVQFERMIKIPKYERYEKRKTNIHARVPDCMKDKFVIGDLVQVSETRPVSKMIHFVLNDIIKSEVGSK